MVQRQLITDIPEREIAYYAGLFDGEGCVCIAKWKPKYGIISFFVSVEISMCDPQALKEMRHIFGVGNIRYLDNGGRGRRPIMKWYCNSRQAEQFLRVIYPYVKIKKLQIEKALQLSSRFRDWKPRCRKLSVNEISIRNRIREELMELKVIDYPEIINGIRAKSANGENPNAVLNKSNSFDFKCVETKRPILAFSK